MEQLATTNATSTIGCAPSKPRQHRRHRRGPSGTLLLASHTLHYATQLLPLLLIALLLPLAVAGSTSKLFDKNLLTGSTFGNSGDWTTGGSGTVNFCASASSSFPCNDGTTRPSGLQTGSSFAMCYSEFSTCSIEQSVSISTSDATPYEYYAAVRSGNALAKVTIKASSAVVIIKRSSGATYKTFTSLATSTTTLATKVFEFPWPQDETQITVAVWNVDKYNTDVANLYSEDEMYVQYLDLKLYGTATMSHSSSALGDTLTRSASSEVGSASMTTSARSPRSSWTASASHTTSATGSRPSRSWSSQLTVTVTKSHSSTLPSRSCSPAITVTSSPSISQSPTQSISPDVTAASRSPTFSTTSTCTASDAVTASGPSPTFSKSETLTLSDEAASHTASLSLTRSIGSATASMTWSATPSPTLSRSAATHDATSTGTSTKTQSASLTQTVTDSEDAPTATSSVSKTRRSATLSHTKSVSVSRTRSGPTASRTPSISRSPSLSKSLSRSRSPTPSLPITVSSELTLSVSRRTPSGPTTSRSPSTSCAVTNSTSVSSSRSPTPSLPITVSSILTVSTTTTVTLTLSPDRSRSSSRSDPTPSCTPTPSRHTLSPTPSFEIEPVTRPPAAMASELTLSAVAGAGGVLSAPVIGVSTLLAAVGDARCVQLARPQHRDWGTASPLLYLLSPFYGSSLGMVVGNLGLMLAFFLIHLVVVRGAAMFSHATEDAVDILVRLRFPHGSLVFAHLCVQGMLLGGWQLIWGAVQGRSPSGVSPAAATVIGACGIALSAAPSLMSLWVRSSLRAPKDDEPAATSTVDLGIAPSAPQWARLVLAHCGPRTVWTPPGPVARFGAAFDDYTASRVVGPWMVVDRWVVACVVLFVCAVDPPADVVVACDVAMFLCGGLLAAFAVWIAVLQPYRLPWSNLLQPACVLLLAAFCMLQAPSSASGMGVDASLVAASSVAILLSACVVVLVVLDVVVSMAVDRHGSTAADDVSPSHGRSPKLHDFKDDVEGRGDRYSDDGAGGGSTSSYAAINAVEEEDGHEGADDGGGDGIEMQGRAAATTSSLPEMRHRSEGWGGVSGDGVAFRSHPPAMAAPFSGGVGHSTFAGGGGPPLTLSAVTADVDVPPSSSHHSRDSSRPITPATMPSDATSSGAQQHQLTGKALQQQQRAAVVVAIDEIDDDML